MSTEQRTHRVYRFPDPRPLTVEIHQQDCVCRFCAPDRLTANAIAKLALAGAAFGTVIAFAIDAPGGAHALLAIVGL